MTYISIKTSEGKWVLSALILASGLAFLAGTTVSIALPAIQTYFSADLSAIQWIVNAYVLALASLILFCGSLGDRFGRKKIFGYGILVFVFGSFISATAQNIQALFVFQAVQGIGAAMMIPGSLAIIDSVFSENERGRAIGLWAGFSGGIASLGPFFGGALVQFFGWPAVFYFNIPIGILAFWAAFRYVPESKSNVPRKLDFAGTFFIVLGLFLISFGFIQAPSSGWSDFQVLGSVVSGLLALTFFVLTEMFTKYPMVPFDVLKNSLVWGANVVTFALYFALNGVIFFLVLNFQQVQGYPPLWAGIGLLPPIVLITFLSGKFGALADKIGPRKQMIAGPLIVSFGMGLLALAGAEARYFYDFLPGLLLFGFGMSVVIAPLTKSALSVPPNFSGLASGVNNAVSRVAALMAIALLGALMASFFNIEIAERIKGSELNEAEKEHILSQRNKLAGIEIPESYSESAAVLINSVIRESFAGGFKRIMIISSFLAFMSAITAYYTIKPKTEISAVIKRQPI